MHIANLTVEELKMGSHVVRHVRRHVELSEAGGAEVHGIDVLTSDDKVAMLKGASMGVEEDTRPLSGGELPYEIPNLGLDGGGDNELIDSRLSDELELWSFQLFRWKELVDGLMKH